jgi:glucose/arabinose dehydrogenase
MNAARRFPMTARLTSLSAAALASLSLVACGDSGVASPSTQYGDKPELPALQQYLLPPMKVAPKGTWGQGEMPTVADGLKVEPLALNLIHPRSLYVLPDGDVLIVEANGPAAPVNRPKDLIMGWVQSIGGAGDVGGNRITLVRPASGGAPALRTVFLDHLKSPFGVALVGNDLYVANTDALMRFPYVAGETHIADAGTKVADLPGGPIDHHWTKNVVARKDGSKLYVSIGSNSNAGENGLDKEVDRAQIWEVDPKTGDHRTFASGIRNPNGMGWAPGGALWVTVNERDEIGGDLVPDYMTSVKDGAFYGWPYSYYGQHIDARVPQNSEMVAKAIPPDFALGTHTASLGLTFSNGAQLGPVYSQGVFIGQHGSWNRKPLNGYRVAFIPFDASGKPAGAAGDVLTGFITPNQDVYGRPVGVAVDQKTGALLVADDSGNVIWRVTKAQ